MYSFLKLVLFIFLSFLFSGFGNLSAQMLVNKRYEIPIKRLDEDDFEVISLQKEGLVVVNLIEPWKYDKDKEFKISFYNSDLEEIKSQSYMIPYIFTQNRFTYFDKDKHLYFFAQDQSNLEVSIFQLQIYTGEARVFTFVPLVKIKVELYYAIDDFAYIIGEYSSKPVVMSFNFLNQTSKVLPAFYEAKEEVKLVQTDVTNKQIYFVISTSNTRRCELVIKPYSQLIGVGNQMLLKDKGQRSAKEGLVYSLDNLQKMVIGTYSLSCSKTPQGVYMAKFENGEQKSINYNKFTDFSNFFSYYGEKTAIRWQKKVEKKRKKGKELNLNRKIDLQQELVEHNNQLVMVMEGYYNSNANTPQYNYNNQLANNPAFYNSPYAYNRNFYPHQNSSSLNFQYNYAIVCGFDKKGRLLWDNSMAIDKVERPQHDRIVQIGYLGDTIALSYLKDWEIFSKSFYRYNDIKQETKQDIKVILSEYGVTENNWGEYIHWYGNHFLLFGEQRLRDSSSQDGLTGKKVFHLTKLSYQVLEEEEEDIAGVKNLREKKKKKDKEEK
jgi:hypothetical protein